MSNHKKCEICGSRGKTYKIDKEKTVYCRTHALDNGFCPSCGTFYMGIEIEDFISIPKYGVCSNCAMETKEELQQEPEEDNTDPEEYNYAQDDFNYDAHRERQSMGRK